MCVCVRAREIQVSRLAQAMQRNLTADKVLQGLWVWCVYLSVKPFKMYCKYHVQVMWAGAALEGFSSYIVVPCILHCIAVNCITRSSESMDPSCWLNINGTAHTRSRSQGAGPASHIHSTHQ